MYSKIQYISSGDTAEEQLQNIIAVLEKGITWVQLRFKTEDSLSLLALAKQIKQLQRTYNFIYIINDHIDIARTVDADGVHLGLEDESIDIARIKLGDKKIIGGTANTLQDILQRVDERCDYIGVGPLRFTKTKKNLSPTLGFKGYQQLFEQLKDRSVPPLFAIGGVRYDDIDVLSKIGLYGVAMSKELEIPTAD
ncbi:thiamine phosphate synthase [Sphingobacterium yanglingense]|uniref:Thiamine-phosphate diphosphorylase n=1 Tax=Sphingobacterium yanglingense TaxID=1437280 RepID=A0A4R6WRW7_9SPHI|nr:thiamine phosphate synthase [Sphingobacterium yanglingense]TDQ79396.1 thiamine-phosphate diphosphorylase [Sphingobacterium yanglingense]